MIGTSHVLYNHHYYPNFVFNCVVYVFYCFIFWVHDVLPFEFLDMSERMNLFSSLSAFLFFIYHFVVFVVRFYVVLRCVTS
jgi:hypothetical protein